METSCCRLGARPRAMTPRHRHPAVMRVPLLLLPVLPLPRLPQAGSKQTDGDSLDMLRKGLSAALRATPFDRSELGGLGRFRIDADAAEEARASLEAAARLRPADARACAALGAVLASFSSLDRVAVEVPLTEALAVDPRSYLALLALGLLRGDVALLRRAAREHPASSGEAWLAIGAALSDSEDGDREVINADAASAFRLAIGLKPSSRQTLGYAGEGLRRLGFEKEASQIFEDAVEAGVWHHPLQRPKYAFWPKLKSTPLPQQVLEADFPWCRAARETVETALVTQGFRKEFEAARLVFSPTASNSGVSYWNLNCAENTTCALRTLGLGDHGFGRWAEYTIWDPTRHEPSFCVTDGFPKMCALTMRLRTGGVPMTRLSVTEVYPPWTYIPKHSSPQQGRLRLLCPLVVPRGSKSRLIFPGHTEATYTTQNHEGACFWFDESFEHEMHYRGPSPRASLLLDMPHPALLADGASELDLEVEAPSLPRFWDLLRGPVAAIASTLGAP